MADRRKSLGNALRHREAAETGSADHSAISGYAWPDIGMRGYIW